MPSGQKRSNSATDATREYDRLQRKIARLEQKKTDLLDSRGYATSRLSFIQDNDDDVTLYTGFPNYTALMTFYEFLEAGPNGSNLRSHCSVDIEGRISELSLENELLMTLMKLRLGLSHDDLAFRFGLEFRTVHNVFESWLGLMNERLNGLTLWLPRSEIRKTLPRSFRRSFPKTRIIFRDVDIATVQTCDWNFSDLNSIVTERRSVVGLAPAGNVLYVSPMFTIREASSKSLESLKTQKFDDGDTYMSTCNHNLLQRMHLLKERNSEFLKRKHDDVTPVKSEEALLSRDLWTVVNRVDEYKILERRLPEEEADIILNVCCRLLNCLSSTQRS